MKSDPIKNGGLKMAYADPPYIGQAKKHYGNHKDYAGEVDQPALIKRLSRDYPDGWALSCSATSLQYLLNHCPDDVRVLIWAKSLFGFIPGVRVQYAYEPVIMRGGRQGSHIKGRAIVKDWVHCAVDGFTFRPMPENHVIGRKPEKFCFWLFDSLGLEPGDQLDDLFPGGGAVTEAWEVYQRLKRIMRYGQIEMFERKEESP